ncbi:hypothetical protein QAD02_022425 [Eretmocerus hayati]|uniref:Uncharacterized protein n=1 Tax=Eretmocerus hayati TaxID=131215 RepID=A0ACC2PSZ8_9HYME|nr:hypothetical protein QAD02_022425 [Eretmocerus hayati]
MLTNVKYSLIYSLLWIFVQGVIGAGENPEVTTSLGRIRGSNLSTRLNKTIYTFRGVRYAKSTEGQRRFKLAEPVDPWGPNIVDDASQEGPSCPFSTVSQYLVSEDCLRLNIYTTKLSTETDKVSRPVIVFFHPGGFYRFSAQSHIFGPQYLLDHDIVLVTVNYRLATLGFIATGDTRAPGNLGLKDQVVALRWIQQNIGPFGGDPSSVTIAGYGAGSSSVALHLLSPMTKGLFHRAITMSGYPTTPEPLPTKQPDLVLRQASFVDCPNDNLDAAFECLKTIPHQRLGDTRAKFAEWYEDPWVVWSPVVEPVIPGVERFLTDQPIDLIRRKEFHHVPVIGGTTQDDFLTLALRPYEEALAGDDSIYQNMTRNWEYAAPISFNYERETEHSRKVSQGLKKFYFNDEPITSKNGKDLGMIYSHALTGFPGHVFAKSMAQNSEAPVYVYAFAYPGRYSFAIDSKTKEPYGVVHYDELIYLFHLSLFKFPLFTEDDPEIDMVKKMTTMWANFAKTSEPIPKDSDLFKGVIWANLNPKIKNVLLISNELTEEDDPAAEPAYDMWAELFPRNKV